MMYCLECNEWTDAYGMKYLRKHARQRQREHVANPHHLFESEDKAWAWRHRVLESNGEGVK